LLLLLLLCIAHLVGKPSPTAARRYAQAAHIIVQRNATQHNTFMIPRKCFQKEGRLGKKRPN
jgi:hypothetical protein